MKARYFKVVAFLWIVSLAAGVSNAQDSPVLDTATQQFQDTAGRDSATAASTLQDTSITEPVVTSVPANRSKSPMWIPLLLSLLALAGVLYLFFIKMDKKQAGPKADFFQKDFVQGTQVLQRAVDELKAKQAALEERIIVLEEANSKAVVEATIEEPIPVPETAEEHPEQAPSRTWYSVVPKNGIFFGRQLEEVFKAREHIYRIEVLDEERAYYYLVDDSATRQHAFNIPDSYILPAMELEGTGRLAEAKHIDIQRGSLLKAGNNWHIEEKAVLNYSV